MVREASNEARSAVYVGKPDLGLSIEGCYADFRNFAGHEDRDGRFKETQNRSFEERAHTDSMFASLRKRSSLSRSILLLFTHLRKATVTFHG